MSDPVQEIRARNLRTVTLLAALFLIPLVAAFCMYYGAAWRPAGRTNHGELIEPARALPRVSSTSGPDTFSKRWSLVYVGDGACTSACRNALYVMRQTQLSLNNDMQRTQRVFLATANCCAEEFLSHEHAGLIVMDAAAASDHGLVQAFPAADRADALFIVDPLGNLMMRFDTRSDPRGLREDLTKLLKLSHIG